MRAIAAGPHTEMVGAYVAEKSGAKLTPGMYQAIAILNDDNDFCGGVTVSEFRDIDCQLCIASETPMAWRPDVCRFVFMYVFEQLGCVRCSAVCKKNNKRVRDFLDHMGFQLEGRIRRGFDGTKDALVYGLLAEECRYLDSYKAPHGDDAVTPQAEAELTE